MLTGFLDWLGGQRKRFRTQRADRSTLMVELLEPRHLLAGDCLGFLTGMGPAWQPDSHAEWCPAILHSVETGMANQDAIPSSDTRELIFLDDLAEQLGEAVELDGFESWPGEDGWWDGELF